MRERPRTARDARPRSGDRKSTRLNSSHGYISYAVFCLKKKKTIANPGSSTPVIKLQKPDSSPLLRLTPSDQFVVFPRESDFHLKSGKNIRADCPTLPQ